MNKYALLLITLLITATVVKAQPKIETSQSFDEPDDGWNKLLQLKNGNTFFFHFTKKDGIDVTVYSKERKVISKRTLTSDKWDADKMSNAHVEGIYEINGQAVIFLQQPDSRAPILYRIILDGNTGRKIRENEIGTLPKTSRFANYAIVFGHADLSDFYVEKDPESDNYAVVQFDGFAHERDKRILVKYYDGNHTELCQAYFNAPDDMYKYLRYIGMVVDGNKGLYLCTYGYNTETSGGKDSRVIISCLKPGEKEFKSNLIDFTEDFKNTNGIMLFNHNTGMIDLLTLTYMTTRGGWIGAAKTSYLSLMSYIDPSTLSVVVSKPLANEKVDNYANHMGIADSYNGVPQQLIINKDNTTTVLEEEMEQEIVTNNKGMVVSEKTLLGNIGISVLNENGTEKDGYAIKKRQVTKGLLSPLYISQKSKGLWSYKKDWFNDNAFMSYDYVTTDKYNYVLFNDAPKNFDNDEGSKRSKAVTYISKTNTVCYRLDNGKTDKFYLFGDPGDNSNSNFCYIESSDYNKSTNTYATLMVARDGRDKQAKIAWVTFE